MFTGIIEKLGKIVNIIDDKTNKHIVVETDFAHELKIDQSIAHNGVCLTVVAIENNLHTVTAVEETLQKTSLNDWKIGNYLNLERCLAFGGRIDGHIVQGHVDQIGFCKNIEDKDGSWFFTFEYDAKEGNLTVEKGSICVNGVSLTVVNAKKNEFSVAIIPYTYTHTQFQYVEIGQKVNLEFDILGKYIKTYLQNL
ncbi:MAG: riboflavin synthase [Bacteroidetes bacterium]|nr:MAG: riboflavin synthase [Bacteroidota bacterium]TAG86543.1 MAG: riboflavin synthase [Bacteroidota bacterium]